MTGDFLAICPITNLDIRENLSFANVELYQYIDEDTLQKKYNVDFGIMDVFQKESCTRSPICVVKFTFDETDDWFNEGNIQIGNLINIISLFQTSIVYIDRGTLWVCPITDGKLGTGKANIGVFLKLIHQKDSR